MFKTVAQSYEGRMCAKRILFYQRFNDQCNVDDVNARWASVLSKLGKGHDYYDFVPVERGRNKID